MAKQGKKSLFSGFKLFGGVTRSTAKGVNLTPGKAVKAPDGEMVLPGETWTASSGDIYQNQDGALELISKYNPRKRDLVHRE